MIPSRSASLLAALALLSAALEAQGSARALRVPAPRARGSFEIVSCSLGCAPGPMGLSCGITEIHVNQEFRITFNQPVDPASVSDNSFRMVDVSSGRTPAAAFALDPLDPSTLIYRPQLTFDSGGNPVFGMLPDHTYFLHIPGTDQDPLGPYLTSVNGDANRTRLVCTLIASLGVADPVPGRPRAKLYVQAVIERDPVTGEPIELATVPAEGAVDVWRESPIRIVFADLMNPATLANPVTGQSSFIHVFFDPDGNVQNVSDQVPIPGSFTLTLDQNTYRTHVIFSAFNGLPASGVQRQPGRVVVVLSAQIQDLSANTLANPGRTTFTTETR